MHGYSVGARVYRILGFVVDKGTKGTVFAYVDGVVGVLFDNGTKWYCDQTSIKPLVRVVG
ncbi:hypothetical protein HOU31_gp13 [Acinetobacter phage vB_AbaP_46-62_Aci07]|uniref:Uncharacterized protein n=1 Tax=Acinetobacter phage vB_AbaP_46-62_Aci07 TaxID=2315468 RepID=A0A386KN32_9CAUD|nr:hypothetical protein HOU31_gp13 [Acinetobacter phage vB_AbaP_46-62_Aci07]AYD85903.1 hypothetical protein Aci07_13 [Acinetobacter phage vB_AbaP_46-62_Aci07]